MTQRYWVYNRIIWLEILQSDVPELHLFLGNTLLVRLCNTSLIWSDLSWKKIILVWNNNCCLLDVPTSHNIWCFNAFTFATPSQTHMYCENKSINPIIYQHWLRTESAGRYAVIKRGNFIIALFSERKFTPTEHAMVVQGQCSPSPPHPTVLIFPSFA